MLPLFDFFFIFYWVLHYLCPVLKTEPSTATDWILESHSIGAGEQLGNPGFQPPRLQIEPQAHPQAHSQHCPRPRQGAALALCSRGPCAGRLQPVMPRSQGETPVVHGADTHTSSPFCEFLRPPVLSPDSQRPTLQPRLVLSPGRSEHPRR